MPVKLARTAGFCYGVRRAMKIALDTAQRGSGALYLLGRLIHNRQAIELLKSRGVRIAERVSDIDKGLVILRAHGATPEERKSLKEAGLGICDATCPHVAKAQSIVRRFSQQGYDCLIVGDRGHAEVEGLMACAEGRGHVVETLEDLAALPEMDKICIVAQTTQNRERFGQVAERVSERYPDAEVHDTICEATSRRQEEALELARQVDAMVVVGDEGSANTRRLTQIARSVCPNTYQVQGPEEVDFNKLKQFTTVGVTAGASTPHWVIRNVVEDLEHLQRQKRTFMYRAAYSFLIFIIHSQIYLALGAAAISAMAMLLMRQGINPLICLLAFFYALSMHVLNKYINLPRDRTLLFGAHKYFSQYDREFLFIGVMSLLLSLVISFTLSVTTFVLMVLSMLLGGVYSFAIVPQGLIKGLKYRRLMDIPGSKDLFMAAAWMVVAVLVPFIEGAGYKELSAIYAFMLSGIFVFALVLVRAIIFDIRDIEGDIVLGRETIPTILGREKVQRVLRVLLAMIFAIPIAGYATGSLPSLALWEELCVVYAAGLFHVPIRQELYQSVWYDAIIDSQFLLAGVIALLWAII